ncbi:hypothetical protein [Staphylococcus aureus]|uniref:hypothetical protein n=1 Tax=Staphylococcus aureus TaxID=1280 RepID=UPI001FF84ACC|nr:hypothetical protein [Staphylococcus aureus]
MFLSLKTLYRKRTVIWPFYFYTIIRTLSIGYIPFIIVAILMSISIFKFGFKNNISIVIGRCIGIFLSWVCVHLFMNIYDSSDYFKPLTTDIFSLFLGVIYFIFIMLIYLVIYGFSHRNK